jgi:hypothetical protein
VTVAVVNYNVSATAAKKTTTAIRDDSAVAVLGDCYTALIVAKRLPYE